MEEVNERLDLILGHFRIEDKAFDLEFVEEQLYSISLNDVSNIDQ